MSDESRPREEITMPIYYDADERYSSRLGNIPSWMPRCINQAMYYRDETNPRVLYFNDGSMEGLLEHHSWEETKTIELDSPNQLPERYDWSQEPDTIHRIHVRFRPNQQRGLPLQVLYSRDARCYVEFNSGGSQGERPPDTHKYLRVYVWDSSYVPVINWAEVPSEFHGIAYWFTGIREHPSSGWGDVDFSGLKMHHHMCPRCKGVKSCSHSDCFNEIKRRCFTCVANYVKPKKKSKYNTFTGSWRTIGDSYVNPTWTAYCAVTDTHASHLARNYENRLQSARETIRETTQRNEQVLVCLSRVAED